MHGANGTTTPRLRARVAVLVAAALSAGAVAARETPFREHHQITVEAHAGYFTEHCMELAEGQVLRYEMTAPHVMDFNLHYHGPDVTTYPVPRQQAREMTGRVHVRDSGHHCFMWTNREQREDVYSVDLRYTVEDAQPAP